MSARVMLGGVGVKRPPAPGARLVSFHLVLAESERDELRALAAEHGVTMARFLVERALTGGWPAERREDRADLRAIRVQLIRLGLNVNQAVKRVHVTGRADELERMAGAVEEMRARLDAALRELR